MLARLAWRWAGSMERASAQAHRAPQRTRFSASAPRGYERQHGHEGLVHAVGGSIERRFECSCRYKCHLVRFATFKETPIWEPWRSNFPNWKPSLWLAAELDLRRQSPRTPTTALLTNKRDDNCQSSISALGLLPRRLWSRQIDGVEPALLV